jgi:hypothetical protein
MAGCGESFPFEVSPNVRRIGDKLAIDAEPIDPVVAVVVEQRLAVPAFDERRFGCGNRDRAAVLSGDRRVPADVVGVAMGVDDEREGRDA